MAIFWRAVTDTPSRLNFDRDSAQITALIAKVESGKPARVQQVNIRRAQLDPIRVYRVGWLRSDPFISEAWLVAVNGPWRTYRDDNGEEWKENGSHWYDHKGRAIAWAMDLLVYRVASRLHTLGDFSDEQRNARRALANIGKLLLEEMPHPPFKPPSPPAST